MGNQTSTVSAAWRRRDRRRTSSTADSSRGKRVKIVMLGAPGVGKTTLFRRLLDQPLAPAAPSELATTTTANIGAKLVLLEGQAPVLVELWDVPAKVYASQAIFETYLQAVDGALLVYDVASPSSWRALVDYHALLSAHAAVRAEAPQPRFAVAVVGNKADALAEQPMVTPSEATRFAQEWTDQQQQQQQDRQAHVWHHHTTVSALEQRHTLELLRIMVQAMVSPPPAPDVAISKVSNEK